MLSASFATADAGTIGLEAAAFDATDAVRLRVGAAAIARAEAFVRLGLLAQANGASGIPLLTLAPGYRCDYAVVPGYGARGVCGLTAEIGVHLRRWETGSIDLRLAHHFAEGARPVAELSAAFAARF